MDEDAPTGAIRRGSRHWKRLALGLLLSPIIAFVASNLALILPPVRHWISAKASARFHQETIVGGASWSPWDGVSLHDVRILQPPTLRKAIPHPLATIDRIQLAPVWRAWLRGRLEVSSITLQTPAITLPLELFSHLSPTYAPPTPPAPQPQPPSRPAPPPAVATPTQAAPSGQAPPPNPPHPPKLPPQPTGWIHLQNASFSAVSATRPLPLLTVDGITGSIPVSGDPAQAPLRIHSLSISGHPAWENLLLDLDWKFPVLSLKPLDLESHGLKFRVAAKIAALQNFPVQLEAQIPKQALPDTELPFAVHARAESVAANAGFRGLALEPPTWAGDLVFETLHPAVKLPGFDGTFDRGSAVTILRGGLLSCVDARLISDEISILGNATLLANGNAAAALRFVAPPAHLENLARTRFPDAGVPRITPLSTPQRSAFDLELAGSIRQLFLRIGKDGPVVNLKP